jgi:hypothetical protein
MRKFAGGRELHTVSMSSAIELAVFALIALNMALVRSQKNLAFSRKTIETHSEHIKQKLIREMLRNSARRAREFFGTAASSLMWPLTCVWQSARIPDDAVAASMWRAEAAGRGVEALLWGKRLHKSKTWRANC